MQEPTISEAELKTMHEDAWIKSAGGRAPKHFRNEITPDERNRRRAKNKQRRASRRKNR